MNLESQLLRDEGFSLRLYLDTRHKWTIGVGRNLSDDGISQAEAMMLLSNDIAEATRSLETTLPWTMALDEVRLAVLVNMVFNLGMGGLLEFKQFLAAVQSGDWTEARDQMLNSEWATQVGDRAQRLATQIEVGQWQ